MSTKRKPRRFAVWLAAVLGIFCVALGLLVVCQAIELHAEGWRMDMGSFPAWLSGLGMIFTAIAAVAAVLAYIGAENQRRDQKMEQARLIVAEHDKEAPLPRPLVVTNHSKEPILNLKVEGLSPVDDRVRIISAIDHHIALEWSVLGPGRKTEGFKLVFYDGATEAAKLNYIQHISFTFSDARDVRWQRVGTGQPVRL